MVGWKLVVSLIVGLLIQFAVSSVQAAKIELIQIPGFDVVAIMMSGEITLGDADTFEKLTESQKKVSVTLSGPGGSLDEGLAIGSIIRERKFVTQVLPDTECDSSCALIWVSGVHRYMSSSSRIGFHAAWHLKDNKPTESGQGNASLGAYLNSIGLRLEAIKYFTSAGPDDLSYLTPRLARALGIETFQTEVDTHNPQNIPTPKQEPTVDNLVFRFTMYASLQFCPSNFEINRKAIADTISSVKSEGVTLVGEEQWANLFVMQIESIKRETLGKSPLWRCLNAIQYLAQKAQPIGIRNPSFDCTGKLNDNERTICETDSLRAYDMAVAELYKTALQSNDEHTTMLVRRAQIAWLKDRLNCRSDAACISKIYSARLTPYLQDKN